MTIWDRVAELVTRRPKRVLGLALLPVVLPLMALPSLRTSHDTLATLPSSAESVQGYEALREHMPEGETAPLVLVVDSDTSVLEPAAFRALGDLSRNLRRLPGVASVRSAAMPTDGARPAEVDQGVAAEAEQLTGNLSEAAQGAGDLAQGIEQVGAGLAEVDRQLPAPGQIGGPQVLQEGLQAAVDGAGDLTVGIGEARRAVSQLRAGVAAVRVGLVELGGGLEEAHHGVGVLRADVAAPTEAALEDAVEALEKFTVGTVDPRFPEAAEAVGEAYARITGRFPPGHPREGAPVDEDYRGLVAALGEVAAGLQQAGSAAAQLNGALGELDGGLDELEAGLGEAASGARHLQVALAGGAEGAEAELADLTGGLAELSAAIARLRAGVTGKLAPGARQLQSGLTEGAQEIDDADVGERALGDSEGPFVLTAGLLEQAPGLRERLGFFVAEDERRTRIFVGLVASPFSDEAIETVTQVRELARTSLLDSPLSDATVLASGPAAFLDEVGRAARRDFPIIVVAVIVGVFLVLVVLLRSVVAPLYMVATVLLSYGAALGVATIVVQGVMGQPGLQWWLPPLLFVLLVALGVDYNIFLMGRVREEAAHRPTRDAVAEGVRHTGRIITSAGVILAGTFAVLLFAPLRSLAQLGVAASVGILLDTFVVRALLVPSLAVLLGRWNWWPSPRAATD